MTVFKAFTRVVKSCRIPIIIYIALLVFFGVMFATSGDNTGSFTASKPNIYIINDDKEEGITKNLIDYMGANCELADIQNTQQAIDDALFFRDVRYVIHIPKGFSEDFLAGKNPTIETKGSGDFYAYLSEMMLNRYMSVASVYVDICDSESELIKNIDDTLSQKVEVSKLSNLDTQNLSKLAQYYNFASYTLLAGAILITSMVLASFNNKNIKRRTLVSSTNISKINLKLLEANSIFSILLWALCVITSIILMKDAMMTKNGMLIATNALLFTICALSIGFFIGTVIGNKDAINGIVNVIALGCAFLCGGFVPRELLPSAVLGFAHILPAYYYIDTNERLSTLENMDIQALTPILKNSAIILGFMILFIILTNIFTRKKEI